MKALVKILFGIVIVAFIGYAGIYTDLLPGSASDVQDQLAQKSLEILDNEEASWAQASHDGQKIILSGEAPGQDAVDEMIERLMLADGRGGFVLGGVTAIDVSAVTIKPVPPVQNPFLWTAALQSGQLSLDGFTPSQNARDAIFQLAAMRFPNRQITGELEIAAGAPPEEKWLNAVSIGLQALARLDEGSIEMSDATLTIDGVTSSQLDVERVQSLTRAAPEGFTASSNVVLRTPTLAAAPVRQQSNAPVANKPEAGAENENGEAERERCEIALTRKANEAKIVFLSNSVNLGRNDQNQLAEFAQMLTDCPQYSLAIIGHTDSSGNEAQNQRLSLNRANSVRNYLASQGVSASRFEVEGAGSSKPLVSNATRRGRAQNRRIEFKLLEQPTQ